MGKSLDHNSKETGIFFEQEFIDFLLFKKDASALEASLEALINSKPCSCQGPSIKPDACKDSEAAAKPGAEEDEAEAFPESEDPALALGRLKLYLLLRMTMPGTYEACCREKGNGSFPNDKCLLNKIGPLNREPLAGNSFDSPLKGSSASLLNWQRTLSALRRYYAVLAADSWIPALAEGNVFGYLRLMQNDPGSGPHKDNFALILVNRSSISSASVSLDLSNLASEFFVDALDNYSRIPLNEGILRLTLGPLEGRLLLKDRWATEIARKRQSGLLLHPTSLPSNYGIGDLGIGAVEFVDFLEGSEQKLWQILPLNPPGYGNSPYQCLSAFAGNPLLIDMDRLVEQGFLKRSQTEEMPSFPEDRVCFEEVSAYKNGLLRKAYKEFWKAPPEPAFQEFCRANRGWLEDYSLFMALKIYHHNAPWNLWEHAAASRSSFALTHYRGLLSEEVNYHKFVQYEFFRQWTALKRYANEKGIRIVGDLPIYVAHDSSDVWKHPELFHLDTSGNPAKVAGVPPDEFTRTGQLWGNPIYRWEVMEETGFRWWKERLGHLSQMVDLVRIDHFRGFEAYWEVPGGEDTAINGRWVKGPGEKLFNAVSGATGNTEIIAEDLGFITPEVEKLKDKFGFPGMSIMQFEMQEGRFMVPLYKSHTVAYTGTHDNDTILGWHKKNYADRSGAEGCAGEICWDYIKMAMHTDAETVIIPLQDILCLGSSARMNTPGTATRNWEWRFKNGQLDEEIREKLRSITKAYHR